MKNKRICKTLSALCLTMVVAFGFTIPAFAQGSGTYTGGECGIGG